jgi:hypothetical protein
MTNMLEVLKLQLGQSMTSMRRFLEKPIKLDDGNISLGASEASLRAQARAEKRRRVRHMRRDLYLLLSHHPSSRQLMRHLAMVERSLHAEGLVGFEALPLRVIAKALTEMESLVRDWSPTGLAELRSRMAVIVKNRPAHSEATADDSKADAAPEPESVHADFDSSLSADVTEIGLAEFEELERSWVGVIPAATQKQSATA